MALALLLLLPVTGFSSPSSAYKDYQSGDFKDSYEEYSRLADKKTNDYRLRYDAGTAAYKAKQLEAAQKQLNAALDTPDIISAPQNQQRTYYNLGNTLYRMGEQSEDPDKKKELWNHAIENYNFALHLTNDADAKNNLAYVKQQLEELKKQQQQQQQQNKDQKDQKDQKNQKDQQQQQQGKDQKDKQDQQQQQGQKSGQQKKDEEKARQEQAKKDQEKKEQQAQANPAEKKDNPDENAEQAAAALLHMTPEEARQLLEAAKDDAKMLIFGPENQPHTNPDRKFKDW